MSKKSSLMAACLKKALKSEETALSTQHVRTIVIDTYKSGAPQLFWEAVVQQPLKSHHIITWKFCQLLHKVLKNGQKLCTYHGIKYCHFLLSIGNHWGSRACFPYDDGYGFCIQKYMKLLVNKLQFHERNTQIPPSLAIPRDEWDNVIGKNSSIHFQLSVEIFDYLEDIISLQKQIFSTSLTYAIGPINECRFMALTTLIEESKLIYFHVVQIMHKLHEQLPFNTLKGHRERFYNIFSETKTFYDKANRLNMFTKILWIPKMSDTPPSFEAKTERTSEHQSQPSYNYQSFDGASKIPNDFLNRSLSQKDLTIYETERHNDSDDFSDFSEDEIIVTGTQLKEEPSAPPVELLMEDHDNAIRKLQQRVKELETHIEVITTENLHLKKELGVFKGKSNEKHSQQFPSLFKPKIISRCSTMKYSSNQNNDRQKPVDRPKSNNFSNVRSFWEGNNLIK